MAPARTISKTPKAAANKKKQTKITGFTTTSASNIKPKSSVRPNASILSYFKKAEDQDLFIENGAGLVVEYEEEQIKGELDVEVEVEREKEEEGEGEDEDICTADDLFGPSPTKGKGSVPGKGKRDGEDKEERYNEDPMPVKRRKLSSGLGGKDQDKEAPTKETTASAGHDDKEAEPEPISRSGTIKGKTRASRESPRTIVGQKTGAKERTHQRPQPGKKKKGPFIDDSDDEDEDGEDLADKAADGGGQSKGEEVKNKGTSRAFEKQTVFSGPDQLTFGEAPPLLRTETSGNDLERDDTADIDRDYNSEEEYFDDSFTGEELREMKYMQELARLEADEAGEDYHEDPGPAGSATLMEECCPICNGSLAGVSETEATAHVNACLDGSPTPLPAASSPTATKTAPPPKVDDNVDSPEMAKRFAKAAIPRAGQAVPFRLGGGDSSSEFNGTGNSAFAKLMSGKAEDSAWATAAAAEHSSRGLPAYKRTCPFYKIMPNNFSICVDAFRYGAVKDCNAYFLSHFHSDHYMGLTARWSHGPIYCSKVTGSLVKTQLKTAAQYVVELEFDEKVPVPNTNGVFVTMIPANHCPGSSLFLFEKVITGGRTQRILHCGDFRACPEHIAHPSLRPNVFDAAEGKIKQQKIDVCYLDTTYLNPRYSFPPQDDVIRSCAELCVALNEGIVSGDDSRWNSLLRRRAGGNPDGTDSVSKFFKSSDKGNTTKGDGMDIKEEDEDMDEDEDENRGELLKTEPAPNAFTAIQKTPSNRNRLLVVCGTYSIGKERICKAIAQALKTKIFASPAKIKICQQLNDPELSSLLTSDPHEAQVHMQMIMEIRAETLAEYLESYRGHFSKIVGFRPSGWNYSPGSSSTSSGGSKLSTSNKSPSGAAAAAAAAVERILGTTGTPVKNITANLAPGSVPTTHLLHGPVWRTRFFTKELTPQRGSGKEAMCFGVPYSEHSSFRELALFLMALRIERVVPTVNVGSEQSRKRMKGWTDRWLAERRRGGVVDVLVERDEENEKKGGDDSIVLWEGKDGKGGGAYW